MDIILTVLIVLTIFVFVYETYKIEKAEDIFDIPGKFEYRLTFTLTIISLLLWLSTS